jgi:anti-sigma B factor antagonist
VENQNRKFTGGKMNITIAQEHGRVPITVLHLEGLLNLGTAEQLERQIQQAHAIGARYFLLDLAGLASLTSAGLRVILAAIKMLGSSDRMKSPYLKLTNPSPDISKILTIAGFDAFVEIYSNRRDAVASF